MPEPSLDNDGPGALLGSELKNKQESVQGGEDVPILLLIDFRPLEKTA